MSENEEMKKKLSQFVQKVNLPKVLGTFDFIFIKQKADSSEGNVSSLQSVERTDLHTTEKIEATKPSIQCIKIMFFFYAI